MHSTSFFFLTHFVVSVKAPFTKKKKNSFFGIFSTLICSLSLWFLRQNIDWEIHCKQFGADVLSFLRRYDQLCVCLFFKKWSVSFIERWKTTTFFEIKCEHQQKRAVTKEVRWRKKVYLFPWTILNTLNEEERTFIWVGAHCTPFRICIVALFSGLLFIMACTLFPPRAKLHAMDFPIDVLP